MSENKQHTIDIFKELKGQHVLIHDKVLRFIAIAQDKYDYLYVMWDGEKLSYHTILDRMSQLRGKIDNDHYQDFVRTSKLNDLDSDDRYSPKNDEEKEIVKLKSEKVKSQVLYELNSMGEEFELLSEICWELN